MLVELDGMLVELDVLDELLGDSLETSEAPDEPLFCGLSGAEALSGRLVIGSLCAALPPSDVTDDDMYDFSLSEIPSNCSGTELQPVIRQQARIRAKIFFIYIPFRDSFL